MSDECPKTFVTCDVCGVDAELENENAWSTRCRNENCLAKGFVLLAAPKENRRYIRYICMCKGAVAYAWTYPSETSFECGICKRKHVITEIVAEIRNKQNIYNTVHTIKEEFEETKEKLNKAEREVEKLRQQAKDFKETISIQSQKLEAEKTSRMAAEEKLKIITNEMEMMQNDNTEKELQKTFLVQQLQDFKERLGKPEDEVKEAEKKIGVVTEENIEPLSKELEKVKNELLVTEMKNKYLEQMLVENKENMNVFRHLLLKRERTQSAHDGEPYQKKHKGNS